MNKIKKALQGITNPNYFTPQKQGLLIGYAWMAIIITIINLFTQITTLTIIATMIIAILLEFIQQAYQNYKTGGS